MRRGGHCYLAAASVARWPAIGSVPSISTKFHLDELPSLLQSRKRVFSDADADVVQPLAFQLPDGRAYTYRPNGHAFSVEQGADRAHTVVELPYDEWCAFVWELRSSFSMFYADQLSIARGSFGQLVRWEPSLRVAFAGQLIYDIDCPPTILGKDGTPLDLSRSFNWTIAMPRSPISWPGQDSCICARFSATMRSASSARSSMAQSPPPAPMIDVRGGPPSTVAMSAAGSII